jgi:hypothetical protein
MKIRPLVIDAAARATIARVIAHAMDHPYRPGPGVGAPGDNQNFVAKLNTYRAVFTFTVTPEACYRHLSVSVPGEKYPNPAAAFMIADAFGFTGWDHKQVEKLPDGWMIDVNKSEHCVVLAQKCERR